MKEIIIKNTQQLSNIIRGNYVVVDEGYHVIIHLDSFIEFPVDIAVFGKLTLTGANESICKLNHSDLVIHLKQEGHCDFKLDVLQKNCLLCVYLTDESIATLHGKHRNPNFQDAIIMFDDSRSFCDVHDSNIDFIIKDTSQAHVVCDNSSVNIQCLHKSRVVVLPKRSDVEIVLRDDAKATVDADDLSTVERKVIS